MVRDIRSDQGELKITVLDILHKNDIKIADMVDIMREQQSNLSKGYTYTVSSGGNHVTCETAREQTSHDGHRYSDLCGKLTLPFMRPGGILQHKRHE